MKIVKAELATLASPLGSTDTSFILQNFRDSKGNLLILSAFGTWLVVVLKSGTITEMIKCSGIVNNSDGTTTISIAANGRDLDPTSPYAGGTIGQDFPAGSDALISNDPYTMSKFVNIEENAVIAGLITFGQVPNTSAGDPLADNDLARKAYVDKIALGILTQVNIVVPGKGGATIVAGNIVYFDSGSGKWKLARADQTATVNNVLLGVAQGAGSDGVAITGGVMLTGLDENQSGLSVGVPMYISDTPGAISATPGTNEVLVGFGGRTAAELLFTPRADKILTKKQSDALAGLSGTLPSTSNKLIDEASIAGMTFPFMGKTAPTGFLLCDGSAVLRSTYARLFAILCPAGVFTVTLASPGVFTLANHGFVAGDRVHLATTGALPTGLSANTDYYVISAGLTSSTFELALSPGGVAINTSGSQSGVHTVYGSPWGKGDGATTFNVPDLRSKMLMGWAPAAGQITLSFEPAAVSTGADDVALIAGVFPSQGQKVQLTTTGTLPAGLSLATDYWIIRVDSTHVGFASTQALANAGTLINITDQGSGVHTIVAANNTHPILGKMGGEENHGVAVVELAGHAHAIVSRASNGTDSGTAAVQTRSTADGTFPSNAAGGDTQHNNLPPYVTVNHIIKI